MAAPKRDAERRRRNKRDPNTKVDDLPFEVNTSPEIPEADEKWHPIAAQLYDSIGSSPARLFMYDLDWAWAYLLAESLSRDLKPQVVGVTERRYDPETGETVEPEAIYATIPLKGASLQAYIKAFGSLGATEMDRLRMHLEVPPVTRPGPKSVDTSTGVVADFAEARRQKALSGGTA